MKKSNFSEQLLSLCGDPQCNISSCSTCEAIGVSVDEQARIQCPNGVPSCRNEILCDKCMTIKYPKHEQPQPRRGAVGGGKKMDMVPLQDFNVEQYRPICEFCQKPEGSNSACDLCATLIKTQNDSQPPFTKQQVEQLHSEMKSRFSPPRTGRIFDLVVLLDCLNIGSINWTMHNCAHSVLALMLSNSNAGLNSINQQTFAGYILAFIIKELQETGKCDPILLEVFRLELSIVSQNPAWSNWSDLVEFQDLYKECVRHKIIIDDEVEFVLQEEDGSYNVRQTLNGKYGSKFFGAYNWSPCIYILANGILSQDFRSRFRVSAVVLYCNGHFSIILISQGIWLIDGKGTRNGPFKAESSIQELTTEQFQQLCRSYGAFYFLEKVPVVHTLVLLGRRDHYLGKFNYAGRWYCLYDNGNMVCEISGTIVKLCRTVFVNDIYDNHFRIFPALPPPPPPPQVPCLQVAQALPNPPYPASFASGPCVPQDPSARVSPLPPPEPTFIFSDGNFKQTNLFSLTTWTYTYTSGKVCFKAEGTFKDEPYSDRKYFYKDKEYCGSIFQTILRDACVEYLKVNLPK
jgi:hypothetical protein